MINRNQLALFYAVAKEGGFGKAARLLRISQPAVSIQISLLEDTLGIRLFERIGRKIRLTEAGETLMIFAQRISSLELEAARSMKELRELRSGRITVGASTTIASYLLPQLMCDFRRAYPKIVLEMRMGNSTRIQQELIDGQVNIALVEGNVIADPLLNIQKFREDQLVPIVPWGHSITSNRHVTLSHLMESPLILREEGSGTRMAILDFLNRKGQGFGETLTFGSTEAVKGAVAAGLGVSFVSSLTVAGDVMLKRLEVINLADAKTIRRPFHVLRVSGRTASPAVDAFVSIIRNR